MSIKAAAAETQNNRAQLLKSFHQPGNPLVLANVWDALSAKAIAALPSTKALATASYAVAAAAGIEDQELTLADNLRAITGIAKVAATYNKPLTADLQDGYGAELQDAVKRLIELGVVGCNLEDFSRGRNGLYEVDEAVSRIELVLRVAAENGVPDFVVNARTDSLLVGLSIDEAIARGKRYLAAGATTVFIWGGRARPGMRTAEVEQAATELGGRLNVSMARVRTGGLGVQELRDIGVARISVGPQLMMRTIGAVAEEAEKIYRGEPVEKDTVIL
ncbi:PEP phosphonomutase-like protein [Periconia macrospinosa]|uniref:PEP phosphonomutase-like protein n=1 Tax=Periconia macrospinosa TaxID=97972 RepID=A0A2V1DZQ1_9PLEO|nr:PEP phosphonomutase-like protein [Periconia macrospinosa]